MESQRVRYNWTEPTDSSLFLMWPWGLISCSLVSQSVSQSVQWLSRVRLFVTPWIAAHQTSLSITNSQSSLKLMSIESVMPSSYLILCRPLLFLPPIPPSIRVFSNESTLRMRWPKYWSWHLASDTYVAFQTQEIFWTTEIKLWKDLFVFRTIYLVVIFIFKKMHSF